MKNKNYIIVLLTIGLLTTGCRNDTKKAGADISTAVPVQVNTVQKESRNPFITVSGTVQAMKSSNLSTRIMGHVDNIYVAIGDKVQNGQLLLRINNADLSAKLAQANASIKETEASFTNAKKDYERFTALFKENSASRKELDDITTNYDMAKARLEAAKQMKSEVNAQFSYTNIRAPFNGVVTNKFIKVGDMANPGMPLLEVEAPKDFQVLAMVPESEIIKIEPDMGVDVNLNSLNKMVKGKVIEVSTSSKNTGGQYLVKVALLDDHTKLLSGMYATVQFPIEEKESEQSIMVPKDAIVERGQLSGIYTVSQNNTALLRWLRLGRTFGDSVEVLSGLSVGERYIINSQSKLYNGANVSLYVK